MHFYQRNASIIELAWLMRGFLLFHFISVSMHFSKRINFYHGYLNNSNLHPCYSLANDQSALTNTLYFYALWFLVKHMT